jgi:hypothetical protein
MQVPSPRSIWMVFAPLRLMRILYSSKSIHAVIIFSVVLQLTALPIFVFAKKTELR